MGIRSCKTLKSIGWVGLGWIGWRFFQNKVLLLTLGTSMLEFVKAEIVSDLHQILELCHYISLKPR